MSRPVIPGTSGCKRPRFEPPPASLLSLPDEALRLIFRLLREDESDDDFIHQPGELYKQSCVAHHPLKELEPSSLAVKGDMLVSIGGSEWIDLAPLVQDTFLASSCKLLNTLYRSEVTTLVFPAPGSEEGNRRLWHRFPAATASVVSCHVARTIDMRLDSACGRAFPFFRRGVIDSSECHPYWPLPINSIHCRLRSLTLSSLSALTVTALQSALKTVDSLETLELLHCSIYDTGPSGGLSSSIPSPIPSLQTVVLAECSFASRDTVFTSSSAVFNLGWLGLSLPSLRKLTLFSDHIDDDSNLFSSHDAYAFLSSLTTIVSLSLHGTSITDAGAKSIFPSLLRLRDLDVSYCGCLTHRSLPWFPPVLDRLDVSYTRILDATFNNYCGSDIDIEPASEQSSECRGIVKALTLGGSPPHNWFSSDFDCMLLALFYKADGINELRVSGSSFDMGSLSWDSLILLRVSR